MDALAYIAAGVLLTLAAAHLLRTARRRWRRLRSRLRRQMVTRTVARTRRPAASARKRR
ncbi:hypothetical protein [Streptomonospora wellingtoniae]|uniref:Uncharacterized protein n=1 Tax=Streptomonospora wellingtoniae TaxID=3075544 RepID=A0ABU2KXF3_9ACTN|nr:hypothetical protein [Streptomonospora sp. DSM 45055]MDT0303995.1 hypothetical protein [Streptomonospora sp. DSM 45055]